MIDSRAIIDPTAKLADDVEVGPWSIIGPNVEIGKGSVIQSHVVIKANTIMGEGNQVYQFASVGEDPADKKFAGEDTWLKMGDNNIIREGVTLHRGTGSGGNWTRIGSNNLFMAYVHVAHDCIVGNNTVFANNAGISGHAEIGDWAILGGFAGVNQFIKIGEHAMVGGMTHIGHDVPACVIVSGTPASVRSVNMVGLERRDYSTEQIRAIRQAFKIVYKKGLQLQEAIVQLKEMVVDYPEIDPFLQSILAASKGIHR